MGLAQLKPEPIYTEEEYLALEREAEERHEYLDGVIYAMAGESPDHGRVSVNLVRIISTHLLGKDCELFTKDMKVRSGPLPKSRFSTKGLYSYPDLVVVCGELKFLDEYQDVLINPAVIIEVLSEKTESFDRVAKFQRYQKYLPLLTDYVLVSQSQRLIEHFHRRAPELWHYTSVSDLKGHLIIPSIKCELRLADVYDRVKFPKAEKGEGKPSTTKARRSGKSKPQKPETRKRASSTSSRSRKR